MHQIYSPRYVVSPRKQSLEFTLSGVGLGELPPHASLKLSSGSVYILEDLVGP